MLACAGSLAALTVLAGCGGGERQDEDEPKGEYKVDVAKAEFPSDQKLAETSDIELVVKNVDSKTIPNLAVTFGRNTKKGRADTLYRRIDDPDLADPRRPIFVINGRPKEIGLLPESVEQVPGGSGSTGASAGGSQTAFVDTWAVGKVKPGETKTMRWNVTAVHAQPFRIVWTVSAGLDGKAKAVLADGQPPTGVFAGTIIDTPPEAKVSDEDGKTVIKEIPESSGD